MKKRVYKPEFKTEAVKLSYERANIKELAEELGIDVQRIYKWRKDSNKAVPLSNSKRTTITISEHKKVQKQLKDTQLELEILKKAIHIFSKKGGSITNL
jgi:transposase